MKEIIVYQPIPLALLEQLKRTFKVTYVPNYRTSEREQFEAALPTVQGLLGAGLFISEAELAKMPQLEVVSQTIAGFDTLVVEDFVARGVMITNAADALTDTVADLTLALTLAVARQLPAVDRAIRRDEWFKGPLDTAEGLYGTDVYGKTIGIIGLGRIGTAVAKRAHAGFGMKVIYHTRSHHLEAEQLYDAVYYADLAGLLSTAYFVIMLAPYNDETHQLMNETAFKTMKKSAYFINVGRGKTVDETALIKALQQGELAGAALDVFEQEPIAANHPLLQLPQVVVSAHMGSATAASRARMISDAVTNLTAALRDTA